MYDEDGSYYELRSDGTRRYVEEPWSFWQWVGAVIVFAYMNALLVTSILMWFR